MKSLTAIYYTRNSLNHKLHILQMNSQTDRQNQLTNKVIPVHPRQNFIRRCLTESLQTKASNIPVQTCNQNTCSMTCLK